MKVRWETNCPECHLDCLLLVTINATRPETASMHARSSPPDSIEFEYEVEEQRCTHNLDLHKNYAVLRERYMEFVEDLH